MSDLALGSVKTTKGMAGNVRSSPRFGQNRRLEVEEMSEVAPGLVKTVTGIAGNV
ncbi:hypothetical protein LC048_15120 [Mesobacillus subterraneus]|uniref:hypothetical protein n=1 Tax=Mesobacillus subterraneus TaxID=285983 RepID=UPI00273D2B39|nr:hypothetical protein [Mesobacillus subterraneus]WLR53839.1 hypothetical protein LC048_15120 [Mesobacillus subterraneus]